MSLPPQLPLTAANKRPALPAVLVAKIGMLAADSAKTLIAWQTCCKSWLSAHDKLDSVWRAMHLSEFECESASDKTIAVDGEKTPWQTRFRLRWEMERDWRRSNFTELRSLWHIKARLCAFVDSLGLLACVVRHEDNSGSEDETTACEGFFVVLLEPASGTELRRWHLPGCALELASSFHIDDVCAPAAAVADATRSDSKSAPAKSDPEPQLAVACDNGKILVWRLPSGERRGRVIQGPSDGSLVCFATCDNLLATGSNFGEIRIYDLDTGEQLHCIVQEDREVDYVHAVNFAAGGVRLYVDTTFSTQCWQLSNEACENCPAALVAPSSASDPSAKSAPASARSSDCSTVDASSDDEQQQKQRSEQPRLLGYVHSTREGRFDAQRERIVINNGRFIQQWSVLPAPKREENAKATVSVKLAVAEAAKSRSDEKEPILSAAATPLSNSPAVSPASSTRCVAQQSEKHENNDDCCESQPQSEQSQREQSAEQPAERSGEQKSAQFDEKSAEQLTEQSAAQREQRRLNEPELCQLEYVCEAPGTVATTSESLRNNRYLINTVFDSLVFIDTLQHLSRFAPFPAEPAAADAIKADSHSAASAAVSSSAAAADAENVASPGASDVSDCSSRRSSVDSTASESKLSSSSSPTSVAAAAAVDPLAAPERAMKFRRKPHNHRRERLNKFVANSRGRAWLLPLTCGEIDQIDTVQGSWRFLFLKLNTGVVRVLDFAAPSQAASNSNSAPSAAAAPAAGSAESDLKSHCANQSH